MLHVLLRIMCHKGVRGISSSKQGTREGKFVGKIISQSNSYKHLYMCVNYLSMWPYRIIRYWQYHSKMMLDHIDSTLVSPCRMIYAHVDMAKKCLVDKSAHLDCHMIYLLFFIYLNMKKKTVTHWNCHVLIEAPSSLHDGLNTN